MEALKCTRRAALVSGAGLLVLIAVLASSSYLRARSVRAQLAQLQERTGISLVTVEHKYILGVNLSRRSGTKLRDLAAGIGAVSPDGSQVASVSDLAPWDLAISRTD